MFSAGSQSYSFGNVFAVIIRRKVQSGVEQFSASIYMHNKRVFQTSELESRQMVQVEAAEWISRHGKQAEVTWEYR